MIYTSFIYSRATSYTNCFNLYIFAANTFYFSYCQIWDMFLIKAAFGSEALARGRSGAYLRAHGYKRKCGKAEDTQYSL